MTINDTNSGNHLINMLKLILNINYFMHLHFIDRQYANVVLSID